MKIVGCCPISTIAFLLVGALLFYTLWFGGCYLLKKYKVSYKKG